MSVEVERGLEGRSFRRLQTARRPLEEELGKYGRRKAALLPTILQSRRRSKMAMQQWQVLVGRKAGSERSQERYGSGRLRQNA